MKFSSEFSFGIEATQTPFGVSPVFAVSAASPSPLTFGEAE
jgi:hypothetical protein